MITGFIKGQVLTISSSVIVESSIDYLEAKFAFQTGDWDGLDKWAHFTNGGTSYVLRLKEDKIGRDMHLNLFAGTWKVYLHGTGKNGMRITTDEAVLTVRTTGAENSEVFPTIPPSVAEQVAMDAAAARETAQKLMEDTESKLTELNESAEIARTAAADADEAAGLARDAAEAGAKGEIERQSEEQARQRAEVNRRDNEVAREARYYDLVNNTNELIQNNYRLQDDANYIIQRAFDSVTTADEATTKANSAAEDARAATEKANASANKADIATSNADAATERADKATEDAVTATEQANEAAINAQGAILNADRATDNANEAANRANDALQGINGKFANALKGKERGGIVSLPDISPIPHTLDVKIRSKNLIPYPYNETTKTKDGITFTVNDDRSITVVGEATVAFVSFNLTYNNVFEEGKTYILSEYMLVSYRTPSGTKYAGGGYAVHTLKWEKEYAIGQIYYQIAKSEGYINRTYYPYIVEATDAAEYTPFVDVSAVKVRAQGKNLLAYPYEETTKTANGLTFTDNGDGSITITGTPTSNYIPFYFTHKNLFNDGVTYALSSDLIVAYVDETGVTKYGFNKLTWKKEYIFRQVYFQSNTMDSINKTLYPQIEVGTVATEYEPYIEPVEYAVNADGTVDNLNSIYPTTVLSADSEDVTIEASYNKDANKVVTSLEDRIAALEAMIINN